MFTNFKEMSQTTVASFKKYADIQKSLLLSLSQQQLDVAAICMESGVKHMHNLAETKDMPSLLSAQSKLADELNKKLIGNFRASMEMVTDAKNQLSDLTENSTKEMQALFIDSAKQAA